MKKGICKLGHFISGDNAYVIKDGRLGCVICRRVRGKRWFDANKTRANELNRKYYKNNILKEKHRKLKQNYGITLDDFNLLIQKQNGVCSISGLPPELNRDLCVDHDHVTGDVRGLLHYNINSALGLFQENPEWLRKAADYIEFWRNKRDGGGFENLADRVPEKSKLSVS